ncbi:MAG: MoxR family ATPase [Acidobacteriota bacterium]
MEWFLSEGPVKLPVGSHSRWVDVEQGTKNKTSRITHFFESGEILAINTALAAGRPLLVRGEAGVGKSQLARAAAKGLERCFVSITVDSRTESKDLLWTFDAVRRLADAQLFAVPGDDKRDSKAELNELNYVSPGPLWWGFAWDQAHKQAEEAKASMPRDAKGQKTAPNGVVVLIDEIDKADSSVPNGLLESLGNLEFTGPTGEVVSCTGRPPLVVITTNEERSLPDAFLRRCLVLQMEVPAEESELKDWLVRRGKAHFGNELDLEVLEEAADQLAADRSSAKQRGLAPPGGAEYLDLLRALHWLKDNTDDRLGLLKEIKKFAFEKHPRENDGR